MGVLEDLANALADDTMKAQNKLNEPYLFEEVAKVLGAASTTMEEAYLTSMRVRLAEKRGRIFLEKRIRELIAQKRAEKEAKGPADQG
ncbi:MAG: hypothetical protein KDK26_19335 [Roseivivax sp.]|nr:hypothetical protein [Roseivivax sp.]